MSFSNIDNPKTWIEPRGDMGVGLRNPVDDVPLYDTGSDPAQQFAHMIPGFLAGTQSRLRHGYSALERYGDAVDLTVVAAELYTGDDLGDPAKREFERKVGESMLVAYSFGTAYPDESIEEAIALPEMYAEELSDPTSDLVCAISVFERLQGALLGAPHVESERFDWGVLFGGPTPDVDHTLHDLLTRGNEGATDAVDELVVDLVFQKLKILRNIGAIGLAVERYAYTHPEVEDGSRIKLLAVTTSTSISIGASMNAAYGVNVREAKQMTPERVPSGHKVAANVISKGWFSEPELVQMLDMAE